MVCQRYTRAYLRHLTQAKEPLSMVLNTIHNLAYYLDLMKSVRDAIAIGTLPSLVARVRAGSKGGSERTGTQNSLGLCR